MYPKLVKVRSGKKNIQEITYLRLAERVKVNGVWREHIVANLGRQDIIGKKEFGELLLKLRKYTDEVLVTPQEIESKQCMDYGAVLIGKKIWEEIGIGKWMTKICGKVASVSLGVSGVLAMVLNRLTKARSKLAMYDWIKTVYLPEWRTDKFNKLIAEDDPKEAAEWYYRTMDWLVKGKRKEKIEESIALWAKTLFPVNVVFYDITNVQFEGWEELKQARHGYIRLGRKNHKQILLGIIMIEGLPVASHIFRGNRAEKTTFLWIKDKVKKQFNVDKVIIVCDRGMISESSLLEIEAKKDGYIVALKRRRCEEVRPLLEKDVSLFTPIRTNKEGDVLLSAWEGEQENGRRRIVVYNPLKAKEEQKKRQDIIKELGEDLNNLSDSIKKGKKNSVKSIIVSAEKILNRKNGKRYFNYTSEKDGDFRYNINEEGLLVEEKLDGKFVIKTTEQNLTIEDIVFRYKELTDIEDGFRELKDFIKVSPVYHWRYRRVKAHIFICMLALLLEKYLEQKLHKAGIKLSARKALDKLKNIKIVENQVKHLNLKYVTPPNQETEKILEACGIFNLPKILNKSDELIENNAVFVKK